jgi:hypothetical protein
MILRQVAVFGIVCLGSLVAQAVTVYTSSNGLVVRDKPSALGSLIIATLKTDTMVETGRQVGDFTAVSVVVDGKVKTGYISTKQLESGISDMGQTGAADMAPSVPELNGAKFSGPEDKPESEFGLKLDRMQIPAADLAKFVKNGQLFARKSKSTSAAAKATQ